MLITNSDLARLEIALNNSFASQFPAAGSNSGLTAFFGNIFRGLAGRRRSHDSASVVFVGGFRGLSLELVGLSGVKRSELHRQQCVTSYLTSECSTGSSRECENQICAV